MKKKIAVTAALLFTLAAAAQQSNPAIDNTVEIDWSEDSTGIVTIQDIINVQQKQARRNTTEDHFLNVWERRGFLNFSYNSAKLSPKGSIPTGASLNNGLVADMSSDWGLSLEYGRSYRLHKTPIANLVNFYLDYTGIDLGVNHFKEEGEGKDLYNSNAKLRFTDSKGKMDSCFYTLWNLAKYEVNYGMTLGPSVTVAPFNNMANPQLHFLKFNLYYHIGYHLSLLFFTDNEDADMNDGSSLSGKFNKEKMDGSTKIEWGHGFTHSFGFNVSWKAIGIGYEHRSRTMKYKATNTSDFGKDKYEFNIGDNRLYIQLRM